LEYVDRYMFKNYSQQKPLGKTKIYCGEQLEKDTVLVEALGTIDELNSFLALTLTKTNNREVKEIVKKVQRYLFIAGSDLSSSTGTNPRINEINVKELEEIINNFDEKLEPINRFVIPGGSEAAIILNNSRAICRRVERRLIELKNKQEMNDHLLKFFNRLSDLLFVLSRYCNKISGIKDELWK